MSKWEPGNHATSRESTLKPFLTLFLATALLASSMLPLSHAETPAPVPAEHQQNFIMWVKATMKMTDDISAILATVKDKDSAEAAAALLPDKVASLATMYATGGIRTESGIADTPEQEALKAAYKAAEKRMFDAAASIAEADSYGSEAMQQIISLF